MSNEFLDTPIEFLKGVGPARADLLKKELGVFSLRNLLTHYPFRYVDRSKIHNISDIRTDMAFIQLKGKIVKVETTGFKRSKRLVAQFKDETGIIELVWFKGIKWVVNQLKPNVEYVVFGKPTPYKGKFNIAHPELGLADEANSKHASSLKGVYGSTEKLGSRGLESKGIAKLISTILHDTRFGFPETLSQEIIKKLNLISRKDAIINIHLPKDEALLQRAQFRLKFEELFYVQLKLLRQKKINQTKFKGYKFTEVGNCVNTFYKEVLPFELTNAQKTVIKEIRKDLGAGIQMNRLLQGDVGSGKTLVALMTMLIGIDNNYQAALMAPTEILATQHYETLSELVDKLKLKVVLLTGSTKAAERKTIHEELEDGSVNIIVGTHALLEDKVKFNNLGIAVIDEQHRFGVAQRAKLWKKNTNPPHILVMTATPIPRTLAMTLYGDLDVSIIDELPPGRKPIKTLHQFDSSRIKVFGFIEKEIKAGRQVYVVYPLIKESEKMDYKDLMDGYESIVRRFPLPEYKVCIVHGQMKPADKEMEMKRFVDGEAHIMVATTVIEVGVNVPNATTMVIESAERFGLSQLHQLRGRVGRGAEQSHCILMTEYALGPEAKTRMETMAATNDGFEIADVDLKLRGPGDLQGTQQSGVLDLSIADLGKDGQILKYARQIAEELLQEDPQLKSDKNRNIFNTYTKLEKTRANWSRIS